MNKKDVDIAVDLYEWTPGGDYIQLSATPAYLGRVSYAGDRSRRQLLHPGRRQAISFQSERLTSRIVQPGSRLVMVLGIVKSPAMQINYGSGREVSDESIADAKVPLRIHWYASSYLEIPVR